MKIYYNLYGRFIKATGDGIFSESENVNKIQFKFEDIPNYSVVFANFMLPFPKESEQYGNYSAQSLLLTRVADEEDGGYMWESIIPNGYLVVGGDFAYVGARVNIPDGTVTIEENEPSEDRTITIDDTTFIITYDENVLVLTNAEDNEEQYRSYFNTIIVRNRLLLIDGTAEHLVLIDGLKVETMEQVQFKIENGGQYIATPVLPELSEQIMFQIQTMQSEIIDINAVLDLKQDKTDNGLQTTNKTVVGGINELKDRVDVINNDINTPTTGLKARISKAEADISDINIEQGVQNTNIQANTTAINAPTTGLNDRVSALEQIVGSGEQYIGTYTNTLDPNDSEELEELKPLISQFVIDNSEQDYPIAGDVVVYIQEIAGGTDKNFKFIYSGSQSDWTFYEIPATEKASNSTYGIVKGSYGEGKNTEISIDNGELDEIWVKDLSNTQRRLAEYLNTDDSRITTNETNIQTNTGKIQTNSGKISVLETKVGNIENGTTVVPNADKSNKDGDGNNIVDTYLTKTSGATKQQLYDYALPRTFNDVSYVGANNKYVDEIPETELPLYSATVSSIGYSELFSVSKTITKGNFQLASKNAYTTTIYVVASADCDVQFRCVSTYAATLFDIVPLNTEITGTIHLTANTITRVNFQSTLNSLNEVITVNENRYIAQTFEVFMTTSSPITFDIYSNETYPSTFYLNTTAQTIYLSQGALGEIPVYEIAGIYSNGEITFTIPNERILINNVESLFKLSYSGEIPLNTNVKMSYNGVDIKLVTPYNFGTNYQSKVSDLEQLNASKTENQYVWIFTAVTRELANEKYFVVDEENLNSLTDIINDKLDKINTNNQIYITNNLGEQTSVTQNTAFNKNFETNTENIKMNGTVSVGESTNIARADHVHPSDTSKQATLISGTNIKTLNNNSLLGSGDLTLNNIGAQAIIDSSHKLDADLVDDTNSTHKFATSSQLSQIATNTGNISTNAGDIATINGKIPSAASSSNQLADKDFVNTAINSFAAYYITKNSSGDPFDTKAVLSSATTFYSGGVARVPTTNDYAIVLADESEGTIVTGYTSFTTTAEYVGYYVIYNNAGVEVTSDNKDSVGITAGTTIAYENLPTTRYTYQGGTYPLGQWEYQYTLNKFSLTTAQLNAINSGITSALVTQIGTNQSNISSLNTNKQDKIDATHKLSADLIEDGTTNKVFTATEQTKLSGIESGAQVNTVTDVKAPTRSGNEVVYTSILDANGVAQIPLPDDDVFGMVRRTSSYGTDIVDGTIRVLQATEQEITDRQQKYKPITPYRLNAAVKSALTDTNHLTMDSTEQSTAQTVLGVNTLTGAGAPTTSTVGRIGQNYIDTTNNDVYECIDIITTTTEPDVVTYTYTWLKLNTDIPSITNEIPVEYGTGKDSVKNKTPYDPTDVDGQGNVINRTNTVAGNFSATFGSRNTIQSNSPETLVSGGKNTAISSEDALIAGYENTTNCAHQSIIGGYNNTVKASESAVFGENQTVDGTIYQDNNGDYKTNSRKLLVYGSDNTVGVNAKNSFIGGSQNTVGDVFENSIVQGKLNNIGDNVEFANVFGGSDNKLHDNLTDCTVFGYHNELYGGADSDHKIGNNYLIGNYNTVQNPSDNNVGLDSVYAFGEKLKARHSSQVLLGKYNKGNSSENKDILTVGCGTADNARANCFATGNNSGTNYIRVGETTLTESKLDDLIQAQIPTSDSDLTNDRYVRYDTDAQGLNDTQKLNARTNIGAGTSNFDGAYSSLTGTPTLGTAAALNTGTSEGNIPILGTNGKLASSVIPASAITETFVVSSEAAMLALSSAEVGDVAVRTDINKSFILKETGADTLSHWQELLTPTDTVLSVNGQTGTVSLSASDVSALSSSTKYGAGLSVSGTSVQLLDQDGNNLGSPITTQDTTYSAATTNSAGLMPALESSSVSTQSQSTKFLREDGTWAAPSYTDASTKMDKSNPTGTGALSINRKANTTVGTNSVAVGDGCTASAEGTFATGYDTTASGSWSHAEGSQTVASNGYAHAEGLYSLASGEAAHAEGLTTSASGSYSHAQGSYTKSQRKSQFVFGEYNVADTTGTTTTRGNYVEIVGNGTAENARSNARTLDWSGNEELAGNIIIKGGKIGDGNNSSYKLAIPTTTSWTSDKTIATTDQIPASITITTTAGSQSVSDGTNTLNFGSNAFNSTAIPNITSTDVTITEVN